MENILLDDLLNNCSTGDLILYNTQCWYSRLMNIGQDLCMIYWYHT